MTTRSCLTILLLLLAVGGPEAARKKKPEPLPEIPVEFRDEPAVFLRDDIRWVWKTYESARMEMRKRLLIQDRRAFDRANEQIVYDAYTESILGFEGKTILPNGKEIPIGESMQRTSTLFKADKIEYRVLHFTFPQVVEGAVLEWRYAIVERDPANQTSWFAQGRLPALQRRFRMEISRGFGDLIWPSYKGFGLAQDLCTIEESNPKKLERTVDIRCRNVPSLPDELASPPASDYQLAFEVAWWPNQVKDIDVRVWGSVRDWVQEREQAFNRKTTQVAPIVAELNLPSLKKEVERADAVYGWLQQHVAFASGSLARRFHRGRRAGGRRRHRSRTRLPAACDVARGRNQRAARLRVGSLRRRALLRPKRPFRAQPIPGPGLHRRSTVDVRPGLSLLPARHHGLALQPRPVHRADGPRRQLGRHGLRAGGGQPRTSGRTLRTAG